MRAVTSVKGQMMAAKMTHEPAEGARAVALRGPCTPPPPPLFENVAEGRLMALRALVSYAQGSRMGRLRHIASSEGGLR